MNKTLLLFAAASMAGVSALAADQILIDEMDYDLYGVYPQFTVDNTRYLFQQGDEAVVIYDSKFNEVNTFALPPSIQLTETTTYQEREYGYIVTGVRNTDEWEILPAGSSQEEIDNVLADEPAILDTVAGDDGATLYITEYLELNGETFTEYPRAYLKLCADMSLWVVKVDYETDYGPYGEWGEEQTETSTYSARGYLNWVSTKDFLYDIDAECTFTQTLFNTDANWEYIVPKYGQKTKSFVNTTTCCVGIVTTEIEYRRGTRIEDKIVGFQVVSETGNVMYDCTFSNGFYLDDNDPQVVVLGDDVYFQFYGCIPNGKDVDYYHLFYSIDRSGAGIAEKQLIKQSASVSPTSVRRNDQVKVTLSQPAERSCKVTVVSSTGRVMQSQPISAGDNGAIINTSNLPSGVYIVNINDGTTIRENCKIIVR
ncbi:MAG: T9SS type A sorting domain-containing protein [Bacteroidales bacterium]|nr:T9SS type A sorting domain-containing protein [Bacteroidales bacterium]